LSTDARPSLRPWRWVFAAVGIYDLVLVTGGVLLGGLLGGRFWYRLLPVPRALDDPFSPARWTLVALHVTAILLGLALVTAAALA
jgi:hypothetical protein